MRNDRAKQNTECDNYSRNFLVSFHNFSLADPTYDSGWCSITVPPNVAKYLGPTLNSWENSGRNRHHPEKKPFP